MQDTVFHENTSIRGVRPLSSVLKTLSVLDLLGSKPNVMRLSEIARETGMSRSTALQKLVTLVQAGWVEQAEGAYRLSLRTTRVANAALEQASLGERIVPFLERLVAKVGETASLAVIEGVSACIVQRVESSGILRAELHVGAPLDLFHSASGRILVAFADQALIDRLRKNGVQLPDEKTLAQVRREHFAPSSGRSFQGVRGIAAPIFDSSGRCITALSLVGPLPRFSVERLRPHLERSAKEIIACLQGRAP